jgi:cell wall-associated NlpC family hydrolase
MTLTNSNSTLCTTTRARRSVRRSVIATMAVTAALLTFGSAVSAQQPELPVNALAPEITAEADLAVAAYDEFVSAGDLETDGLVAYVNYATHRTATARLAARQLGYDEFAMIAAWQSTSLDHQRAVLATMTQIGVPYRTNTSVEDEGFDCSGLTFYAWQASGVTLNRISGDQIGAATKMDRSTAKAGDLVHYPGHVMMYLGVDDAIVHSINSGRTVEIDTISKSRTDRVTFGDPLNV